MCGDSRKIKNWQTCGVLMFVFVSVALIGCSEKPVPRVQSADPNTRAQPALDGGIDPAENEPSTTKTAPVEPEGDPVRLFLVDREGRTPTEDRASFTDAQLHKNFTLLMLSFEPDIRARALAKYLRNVMTAEQKTAALELALAEDHKFQKILRRRSEIYENAMDGQDVEKELRKIEEETVKTSRMVRLSIHNNVLTQEQRDALSAAKKLRDQAAAEATETTK